MMRAQFMVLTVTVVLAVACAPAPEEIPSALARDTAAHARTTYADAALETLADLLAFKTVHEDGTANAEHPEFVRMTDYLRDKAAELGLEFADHGAVVVIALGDATDRIGLVTHGDVQPADPTKWSGDPFSLDTTSEPGRLVGRGVEDDKGPIVTALYAMKAVKDRGIPLSRRVELIISYTEESDWAPFQAFLEANEPPPLNVALDAEYPLVVAENGWCMIEARIPPLPEDRAATPRIVGITGGVFPSQVPGDAKATIAFSNDDVEQALRRAAEEDPDVDYEFTHQDGRLIVTALGLAAHSSKPWTGRNAVTHLAATLGRLEWPTTQASRMIDWINDLVGTDDYAERFGDLAYSHPFMGRLTLSLTTLKQDGDDLVAGINLRRPAGRTGEQMDKAIADAIEAWKQSSGTDGLTYTTYIGEPYYIQDAPHVRVLLDVFGHFAGVEKPEPISIGGGTHARLLPAAVNFGPAMPGEEYTGHSEHEFMSGETYLLGLDMYTAMIVELAGED